MAVFGKTPLTKAVSKFAGDFNLDLQNELELLYAPQNTQLNALRNKMQETQSYDAGREQIMARMIAADRGVDSVESTALARMMQPETPMPPPPGTAGIAGLPGEEGIPLPPLPPPMGPVLPQDMEIQRMGFPVPDIDIPWGKIGSGIGDFFGGVGSAIGDFATDPVVQQKLFSSQGGIAPPVFGQNLAKEQITEDLTLDVLASYPTWSTTEKILGVTDILRKIHTDTGGGPAYDAKVREIAGYIGENEGDTVVRSAITSMVNELSRDFVSSVTGPAAVSDRSSYIQSSDTVSATDSTGDREVTQAIADNEEVQAKVDGATWLEWLSEVDSGKSLIYNVFKGENPTFRMMNPRAEGLYNRWEKQLRHQFNIELTNPNSPWNSELPTGSNEQGAEIVNRNYKEYLRAAFDPENRTANLWSGDDWQRNMEQVSANTNDLTYRSSFTQGAVAGEEAVPQDRMLGGVLESLARDPETVKQWIIAKSTKGANPIVARYAPQSIGREVDKWVMDNTEIPTLEYGTPTSDYEEQGDAASVAAKSLFQEWAKRNFRWFGSNGYGRA